MLSLGGKFATEICALLLFWFSTLYVLGFGVCWIVLSLAGFRARLTFVE
jgi:hypothetical protein